MLSVPTPVCEISEAHLSTDYRTAKSLRIKKEEEEKESSQDRKYTMLGSRRYLWGVNQYSVGRLELQRATRNTWLSKGRQ